MTATNREGLWSFVTRSGHVLFHTGRLFFAEEVPRLGAALAFYTTIAVAPLLVIALTLAGFFFDEHSARDRVLEEIEQLAGHRVSAALASVEEPAQETYGEFATVLGALVLIFGASGVFRNLRTSLDTIWHVSPPEAQSWWRFLLHQVFSFATVMATGFLLLVSLIFSAMLSWVGSHALMRSGFSSTLLEIANFALSFGVITLLFAITFKVFPNCEVPWRHVWLGACFTAMLFALGKTLLGWYLGRAATTSAYGTASSVLVLLLWSYYASQIIFLGAVFTRVATLSNGGRAIDRLSQGTA